MDLAETSDRFEAALDLPGLTAADVQIVADEDMLAVVGDKRPEHAGEEWRHRVSERRFGTFSRAVAMPPNVDLDAISATMEAGVLRIILPKQAETRARVIPIAVAGAAAPRT